MGTLSDAIRIGDTVCLYAVSNQGYVYSLQSSSVHSELAVQAAVKKEDPGIPDVQAISFQVCMPNRYKLTKAYRKLRGKSKSEGGQLGEEDSSEFLAQLNEAGRNSEAENEDNNIEQKKYRGSQLYYGQVIQLRHMYTQKYIHISTNKMAKEEKTEMRVELNAFNAKEAMFRVMPKYKVKSEGDVVQSEDQVVFESVKTVGQYLHSSKAVHAAKTVYSGSHELNLSIHGTAFLISCRYKPDPSHENLLNNGALVRLFHKEFEAYLCAEGLFNYKIVEDVHLRVREIDYSKPKTAFPTSSAINYWQIELQDQQMSGHVIRWDQPFLLKHVLTRQYLSLDDKSSQMGLSSHRDDPTNVFRAHPVTVDQSDYISQGTFCRIEHVITGSWLHAINKSISRNSDKDNTGSFQLKWTTARMIKATVSHEMQFADAFTLQVVQDDDVSNSYYALGMVPFLQKLVRDMNHKVKLAAKDSHDIVQALEEMREFMVVDGEPDKKRQKLMRNLMLIELLVTILKSRPPIVGINLVRVYAEIYQFIQTYLLGNSRKNELYLAKYLDFFLHQLQLQGSIGLKATHMVTELIRDNRKIVDRVTRTHIELFVRMLEKHKDPHYLELLEVLCVCDGVAMPDNQKTIAEIWLLQKKCVYHTVLGKEIKLEPRVVYVSWDNGSTWVALHEFAQTNSAEGEKRRSFLRNQLELFGKLCRGRNKFCIDVITDELKYLTWEEAFICVSDEQMPDAVRAKYCDLIIDLFVDVEGNNSLLDNITLTFLYDNIGHGQDKQGGGDKNHPQKGNWTGGGMSQLENIMEQLQVWIASFLDSNKAMVASREGHNMLIKQVLSLLKYLVEFGYYSNTESIDRLREPLLGFLDGRNDLPYPMKYTVANPDFDEFHGLSRFKKNYQNNIMVEAKYQAMEILDLLMNFQFNMRLESFVGEFKHLHHQVNSPKLQQAAAQATHPLMALLKDSFNLEKEQRVAMSAKVVLDRLFQDLQRFSSLKEILMDLSHYVSYSDMVTRSMSLLSRYYSMYENLFNRAVQAQILVTDLSCRVYNDLQEVVPVLRKLSRSRQDSTQTNKTLEILDKLIRFSCYDMEVEIHPMNQTIIYNYGILSDVFEILSQEIDLQLSDKYGGFQMVVQKCCSLLKVLAKENSLVQDRLFDRLDLLLTVQGAEEELAGALTEVFTGNKSNCLKIHFKQIQKMVSIAAKHGREAPQLFSLLQAVVKVEEMDLPLKRNQDYVIKYFTQFRGSFDQVLDCGKTKRINILSFGGTKDCVFLTSLVDLMASCSEGENKFIESLCQNVLGTNEIVEVLAANNMDKVVKRAYVRFLHWVYLNTGGEQTEVTQLAKDRRLWEFIENLYGDFEETAKFAKQSKITTQQILRRRSDQRSPPQIQASHDLIHFLVDAVVPFLEIYFKSIFPQVKEELGPTCKRAVDRVAQIYVQFCEAILPQVTQLSIQQQMLSCATSLVTASALPLAMLDRLQDRYGSRSADKMKSNAQKRYEQYYNGELSLNEQFNQFTNNFSLVFGGLNTVQAQIGYPSQQDYTEVGEDEDLPLGPEFQAYIQCFINPGESSPEEKYRPASVLLEQLEISERIQHKGERQRLAQEQLDIKCMQVLRGIVHNEVVKLPVGWESNPKLCHRQLSQIEQIQNALDSYGAMRKLVVHLNSGVSEVTIKEALALMVKLLYGGNHRTQNSLAQYFHSTREERFFVTIKSRMQIAALAVKEKRGLVAQHQAIVQEAIERIKMIKSALERGDISAQDISTEMGSTIMKAQKSFQKVHGDKSLVAPGSRISLASSRARLHKTGPSMGSRSSVNRHEEKSGRSFDKGVTKRLDRLMELAEDGRVTAADLEQLDVKALEERLFTMSMKQEEDISQGESYMTLMLRVMGLMCDGQFIDLQDYMREQLDNFLSADLVSETTKFLGFVYGNINGHNVELVTELLQTLVEFVSGNYKNQVVVFDNKVCDYLDFILQGALYVGCSEIEILEVKKTIGNLIRALTEENLSEDTPLDVPTIVMENLEPSSIAGIVKDSYKKYQNRKLSSEVRELALTVAFQYYFVLCRMKELREDKNKLKNVLGVPEDKSMWRHLEKNSMSVEITKDDQIHRMRFPVRYQASLRSEVKTRFNYEVDRTASERINDFMEWVVDLKRDVFYTRKIIDSDLSYFFVKMWYPANILMMFLSFVVMVLISVTYEAPEDESQWSPELRYNFPSLVFLILGIIHVVVTGCVLISYFIINKPKLPTWMRRAWRKLKRLIKRDQDSTEEVDEGAGHLDIHFLGMKTVWYLILMLMSILGVISQGYLLTIHLLHISEFNQLLKRALQAVSRNGISLIMIFLFGLIIIFVFAQINFAFYRKIFDASSGLYCTTMYECFVTVFHRGLIVSLYEGIPPIEGEPFTFYLHKAFTDLLFFMVITVVGLDIVFGIVVDTFAELRDSKWQADQEMNATCFICGMDSHLFEKKPGGFEHHVKHEHCQWAYLYLFMHLEETRPNDYTALELYVSQKLSDENFSFFPLDRALSLEHEIDEKEERINYLERQVTYLVNKIKEQEASKERAVERQRLLQWEKKYKTPRKGGDRLAEKRVIISDVDEFSRSKSPEKSPQAESSSPTRPSSRKDPVRPGTARLKGSPYRPGTSKSTASRPGTARGKGRPL